MARRTFVPSRRIVVAYRLGSTAWELYTRLCRLLALGTSLRKNDYQPFLLAHLQSRSLTRYPLSPSTYVSQAVASIRSARLARNVGHRFAANNTQLFASCSPRVEILNLRNGKTNLRPVPSHSRRLSPRLHCVGAVHSALPTPCFGDFASQKRLSTVFARSPSESESDALSA